MSDQFACPKCGATYTREKRRIGKAVVCGCGHKFLVPPPETGASPPMAAPVRSPQPRANPKPTPGRPRNPARASDSSGEVILVPQTAARPAPPAPPPQARWAEPIEPLEAEPVMEAEAVMDDDAVMEAEVVYPAAGYGAPPAAADGVFSTSGAYGDPTAMGHVIKPLPPRSAPQSASAADEPRRERRTKRSPRPLGVFLLALLYFLIAAIVLSAGPFVASFPHRGGSASAAMFISAFVAFFPLAMGVGLFRGGKWAWWLSAFSHAWMICGGVGAIITSLIFANQLVPGAGVYLFIRVVVQFVVSSFLLSYLMTENVLTFFSLRRLDTGQALGILFGLAIILTLLAHVTLYLLLRARYAPEPSRQTAPASTNSVPVGNEPTPSGSGITIWDAKQRAGGVFSVEYRVDSALSPAGSYFWVINGPAGNVEFPIPGTTWAKQRQQLSGRAPAAGGTELNGPLTCYIEEQVGSTRRRISNQVPVGQ